MRAREERKALYRGTEASAFSCSRAFLFFFGRRAAFPARGRARASAPSTHQSVSTLKKVKREGGSTAPPGPN